MGRNKTGLITTGEAVRLELSYLIHAGYIKQGQKNVGSIGWTNGSMISIESNVANDNSFVRLNYKNESYLTGEVTHHDYKIQLTSIPSNLGIGRIWYFVCPVSGHRARILYKCYGSLVFKSRKAYRHRIYYLCQTNSKYEYHNTRFWNIDKTLEKLYKTATKSHYKGQETRIQQRIQYLENRQQYHDEMRFITMPMSLRKYF